MPSWLGKKPAKHDRKRPDSDSLANATLAAASVALEAAKNLAPYAPVPALSTIYATAAVIIKLAEVWDFA